MKRCSFCEWIPILPWPVWPLAEQCSLGQNVVVGSMLVLQVALGNVPRGVCLDPRLHYKCTSPRLPAELPLKSPGVLSVCYADACVHESTRSRHASITCLLPQHLPTDSSTLNRGHEHQRAM